MFAGQIPRMPWGCNPSASVCAFVIAALCSFSSAAADAPVGRFVDRIYRDADGDHKYVVFEPAGYQPSKKWPLIFYLHGASGRGTDGRAPLIVGMGPAVKHRAATLPFLVVFPQCENLRSRLLGGWHEEPRELERALKILETVESDYSVDRGHEVLVGTSMGGFGVWDLASRTPQRWKAVIPISGGGRDDMIPALTKVPVWAFHAMDDTLVPPAESTRLVEGIRDAGGRAFVSLLPRGGHNISRSVLARDEVFDWMLHPERDPVANFDWTQEDDLPNLMDQLPFVPGADVAQAMRIHIGRDLLQSWGHILPALVPPETLQGWRPGTSDAGQSGMFRFNLTTGGIQYSGTLEQAFMEPLPNNRLRIQLGLRSMQMTVLSTHVRGRMFSADAGPVTMYIGYQAPVWLTMDIAPRVADRRLHLDLVGVDFQIAPDNWSVSAPAGVRVRGMPLLRNRIAGEVTQGITQGVAARRPMIEAEIKNSVPRMVADMEARLAEHQNRVVDFGRWPMPLWQPRFRLYPESVVVGEHGVDVVVGVIVAQLGQRPPGSQLMTFPADEQPLPPPAVDGLEYTVAERLVVAWSALLADSNVARFDVLDMNSPIFRELGRREFWNETLPAIRQLPETTELQTEFVLLKPLDLQSRTEATPGQPQSELFIAIPQLRLELSLREKGRRDLTPYASFDVSLVQGYRYSVAKPSFTRREMKQALIPIEQPDITPQLLPPGVQPGDVDMNRIATQFVRGWADNFAIQGSTAVLQDLVVSKLPLRWHEVGWDGARLISRWQRPGILIVNGTSAPVSYKVRGLTTVWSEPFHLAPGQSHEYRPATEMIWQQVADGNFPPYRLTLGEAFELREKGAATTSAVERSSAAAP